MSTPQVYLERANITVNSLQEAIDFFQTAFPHFKRRGGGHGTRERVHLGDDNTYIAINQAKYSDLKVDKNYDTMGINHIGFVVEKNCLEAAKEAPHINGKRLKEVEIRYHYNN